MTDDDATGWDLIPWPYEKIAKACGMDYDECHIRGDRRIPDLIMPTPGLKLTKGWLESDELE